jgi:chemotaxis family two-component system response regulator Rcp1
VWQKIGSQVILLIEDSKADARLVQEVLKTSTVPHELQIVRDGLAAMDYLRQQAEYVEAPRPHLIVLDLNLPKKDGEVII